jgi:TRAP-type C4-dicarboxylate transport system permease small subunit
MGKQRKGDRLLGIATGVIKAGDFLASYVFLVLMVGLMAIDPIMRYIFGSPFYWSNEVTTFLMMLVVFNGLGVALAKDKHIRVMLVFNRLPAKIQNLLWVGISFAGLFYVAFMGYALLRLTLSSMAYGVRTATAEMIVYPWQMMALVGMVVFAAAMVMHTAQRVAIAAGKREADGKDDQDVIEPARPGR